MEAGVKWKWVPGSSFPSTGRWEKENSEAVKVEITSSLFADETTIIGNSEEVSTGLMAGLERGPETEEEESGSSLD